ncbi:MAG: glycoside hydrolase family 3 N-terminal domain-containing protein [Syntrophomonas sp.]|nr:glycoside hydrolase family 3 N-terminal domain-containing protein [Syntrophomonas sp.]
MAKTHRLIISLWIMILLLFPYSVLASPGLARPGALHSFSPSVEILSKLTLEEKIGQMILLGFQGTKVSEPLSAVIKEIRPGGVILYGSNIINPQQTVTLTRELQHASAVPLFISTDEEGGVVSRIAGGTTLPGALALGAAGSAQLAYQAGQAIGEELMALGINVDFAPVLDVLHEPDYSGLGTRCLSADPASVALMGQEFARGLNDARVIAGVKHFPGHGLAPLDSHQDIPVVGASREEMAADIEPFRQAINGGAEMIMVAHVAYPALDSTQIISHLHQEPIYLPASLSASVINGLAREEIGYQGIIITDSLLMRPIIDHFGSQEEAAVMAIKAGSDLVLIQRERDARHVQQRLLKAVRSGEISEARLNESVLRLLELKLKRGIIEYIYNRISPGTAANCSIEEGRKLAQERVGSNVHRSLQQEIANKAVTLLKNNQNTLPLHLTEGQNVVCYVPIKSMVPKVRESLAEIQSTLGIKKLNVSVHYYQTQSMPDNKQLSGMAAADHLILLTYGKLNFTILGLFEPHNNFPVAIANQACKPGKKLTVITPAPIREQSFLSAVPAVILNYGNSQANIKAGFNAAFGLIKPAGKLPVTIQSTAGEIIYNAGYGLSYP